MSVPARLTAFAAALAIVFGGAFAVGHAVGPADDPPPPTVHDGGVHP